MKKALTIQIPRINKSSDYTQYAGYHTSSNCSSFIKKLVNRYGLYLAREKRYNICPFDAFDPEDTWECYMFSDANFSNYAPIGTAVFWNTVYYTTYDTMWYLVFIWIHPYFRNLGLLKCKWYEFIDRYGDFYPMHPFSDSMAGFLNKFATDKQREYYNNDFDIWINKD